MTDTNDAISESALTEGSGACDPVDINPSVVHGPTEAFLKRCPICGGEKFGLGPHGRMSGTGVMPKCVMCGSLERHRIVHRIMEAIPPVLTQQAKMLQFSPDLALNRQRFARFDVSIYGGEYSLDIQATGLCTGEYDWIIANHVLPFVPDRPAALREMLRVVGPEGIVILTVGTPTYKAETIHYKVPTGQDEAYCVYGADFSGIIQAVMPEAAVLEVVGADLVTAITDVVYFYSLAPSKLKQMAGEFASRNFFAHLFPARPTELGGRLPGECARVIADLSGPAILDTIIIAPEWDRLRDEVTRWRDLGLEPRFWLRDDDAIKVNGRLDQLWRLCADHHVDWMMAAIPGLCEPTLADWVHSHPGVFVAQHGTFHEQCSAERKSEFPEDLRLGTVVTRVREGARIMARLFGVNPGLVFVPPWNHCAKRVIGQLPSLGFTGYSAGKMRTRPQPGLVMAHVHASLCRAGATAWEPFDVALFAGDVAAALAKLRVHRKTSEPFGVNTHHRNTERDAFAGLSELFTVTRELSIGWESPKKLFAPVPAVSGLVSEALSDSASGMQTAAFRAWNAASQMLIG